MTGLAFIFAGLCFASLGGHIGADHRHFWVVQAIDAVAFALAWVGWAGARWGGSR